MTATADLDDVRTCAQETVGVSTLALPPPSPRGVRPPQAGHAGQHGLSDAHHPAKGGSASSPGWGPDMKTPEPHDITAVIASVRRDGSVMWPLAALPDDFLGWRRRVRAAAREAHLRISVRRVKEVAFVEHLDHLVTDDQYSAFGKVVEAQIDGREISWNQALHEAARDLMTAVPDKSPPPADD